MRIISFSKKWEKLNQPIFTTFRMPRKDTLKGRDWHLNEVVQVYYHNRQPDRELLGTARIINKDPRRICSIDDEEAVADGFTGGIAEMLDWLNTAHGRTLEPNTLINKLTLEYYFKEGK